MAVSNGVTEQDLTNALIKLNAVGEQKVYFTTGHGEWPLEPAQPRDPASLSELRKTLLQEGYLPGTLNLADGKEVPADAALVVVAGAKSKFGKAEAEQLGKYLEQGGPDALLRRGRGGARASIRSSRATASRWTRAWWPTTSTPSTAPTWWSRTSSATPSWRATSSGASTTSSSPRCAASPCSDEGLAEGTEVAPVLLTSPNGFEVKTPTENPQRQSGDKAGSIPLIVQSTRPVGNAEGKRNDEMRLVVFGDSEILVDPNWGDEPNRNMVMNAFAWATSQVQKITIRPPDRDISTIDLDAPRLARIRFLATDLVPFGLLGIGLAIWLNRRSK